LTAVIASEHGFDIDQEGYQAAFAQHQTISGGRLGLQEIDPIYKKLLNQHGPTEFVGHNLFVSTGKVLALLKPDDSQKLQAVKQAAKGQIVHALVSPTPFYGETGGQTGDHGVVKAEKLTAKVIDAQRPIPELIVLTVQIEEGTLIRDQLISQSVDNARRQKISLNHSATHLLQAALRKILGDHVNQKGSLVTPDRLRFDFSHFSPLSADEIKRSEQEVNRLIRKNLLIHTEECSLKQARREGATMLFGEKYADTVRMVKMGEASLELCGGTHAHRTGNIGFFFIQTESAVQAGARRIEALTGDTAIRLNQTLLSQLKKAAGTLGTTPTDLPERARQLAESERALQKQVVQWKQKLATQGAGRNPLEAARQIHGVSVLATKIEGIELAGLRAVADQLRNKLDGGIVLLLAEQKGKLSTVCTVDKALTQRIKAGDLLKGLLQITGGRGGGRLDFAQGGGGDPEKVSKAIEQFYSLVEAALSE
jgi:alanyl-tRNA synthetase